MIGFFCKLQAVSYKPQAFFNKEAKRIQNRTIGSTFSLVTSLPSCASLLKMKILVKLVLQYFPLKFSSHDRFLGIKQVIFVGFFKSI